MCVIFNTSAGCAYVSRLLESFRAFRPCLSACVCACVSVLVHTCDSDSIPIYPTTKKTRSSRTSVPLGINHFAHQDSSRFFSRCWFFFFLPVTLLSLSTLSERSDDLAWSSMRLILVTLETVRIVVAGWDFFFFLVCSPHLSRLALFRVV